MDLLIPLVVFLGLVPGGGLALADAFPRADPAARFPLGLAAGLLGLFLLVFLTHVLALSLDRLAGRARSARPPSAPFHPRTPRGE